MTDKPYSFSPSPSSRDTARVLVVEDNPSNRKLIGHQLTTLGYAVDLAETAGTGLELWRAGRYDAVLTDCRLPGMSGFELAQVIREEEADVLAPIPIIALTGDNSEQIAERCYASGMNECITKPALMDQLDMVLTRWTGSPSAVQETDCEKGR